MTQSTRIHAFDLLRALAMTWGIFFHGALPFMETPAPDWPLRDPTYHATLLDFLVWASHRIRMPLFFIMSGYFSYMLLERRGTIEFLKNRLKKIGLPLLLGLLIIIPIVIEVFTVNKGLLNPFRLEVLMEIRPAHLWFLYYLLFFYGIFYIQSKIIRKGTSPYENLKEKIFSLEGLIGLVFLLSFLHFFMIKIENINSTTSFVLDPLAFIYYYLFFFIGTLLYGIKDLDGLFNFDLKSIFKFLLPITIITPLLLLAFKKGFIAEDFTRMLASFFQAVYCLLGLILCTGFTFKNYQKENPAISYLCDSSYWLYLWHVPLVVFFQKITISWDTPAILKWSFTSFASLLVLLVSYEFLVRYSAIGSFLHGKRTKEQTRKLFKRKNNEEFFKESL